MSFGTPHVKSPGAPRKKAPGEAKAPTPAAHEPERAETSVLKLDPTGASSPSIASARNAVRHRLRDGVPTLDTNPVPFNMVQLESLTDQIPLTPNLKIFQVRYQDIPTQRYMNAHVVAGTLVAYVDGSWTPTIPTVDVNQNGNFTLASAPQNQLLVTYAWQFLSDGEINQFLDEARQWLREFSTISQVPDGLTHALISYASSRALYALQRSAILAPVKAGDSDVDWSKLAEGYNTLANQQYKLAITERSEFYSQGPESLDPTAISVGAISIGPYTPIR